MNLNHLKRALALVLALVCAVPVAFAQEDPVAVIVEEATAAYVDETVEELGELSLGEFVGEEPVEEVPEEEEVTEEAADEEALDLDLDLNSMRVLLPDDPEVANMQLNAMAGCDHSSGNKESVLVFANKSGKSTVKKYEVCDEKSHWTIGDLYLYEHCLVCWKTEYVGLVKKNARINYFHSFNSKGKCASCGYKNKVEEYTEVVREYVADESIKPVNDGSAEGHLITGDLMDRTYVHYDSVSSGCDTDLDVIVEANVQWREPHTLKNGKCTSCAYKVGCVHESVEIRPDYYLRSNCYDNGDEFVHNYYDSWTDRVYCLECGSELTDYVPEGSTETYPVVRKSSKEAMQEHTYENGRCMQCGHKAAFKLEGKTLKMGVGEKYTLKYAFTNELGECNVTFSSGKKSIATVDKATGEITAKKTGTVTITAKAANGKKATCKVTVYKKPTSVKLNKSELVLGVGETAKLTAKLSSKSFTRLSWTVDEANPIVSFDENGVITANAVGTTTVTATTHNNLTAACTITVKAAPTDDDIAITVDKGTIGVKETTYVRASLSDSCAGKITYSTEDSTVSVDKETGKVTGKAVGKAIVVATAYNGAATAIEMEIKAAPSKVRITNAPKKLGVGQKYQLEVKLGADDEDCEGTVTFSSSNSKIASVDKATGKITPKKTGTVKITATSHHSKKVKHTVTIKVYKKPKSVKLNKRTLQLGVGESYDLDVKLSSGSYSPIKWVNENSEYISLDQNGLVTANAVGHAAAVAYLYDENYYDICEIDVGYAPERVEFDIDVMVLHVGQKATFTAKPVSSLGTSYGKVTYSSSDKSVATVSSSGKVTPKKYGMTTITAVSYTGESDSYDLAVLPAVKSVKINIPSRIPVGTVIGMDSDGEYTATGVFDYITISPDKVGVSMFAITDIKSSKPSVADVCLLDEDGMPVLVAFKKGKFTLTVKTYNGKTAKKTITVY